MRHLLQWSMCVLALLVVTPVMAQEAEPAKQGTVKAEDPRESLVRKIASELRCAVCQSQSVYDSNSGLAKDMLKVVRDKVHAGEQEDDIRRYFLERYGDYIYMEPVMNSRNMALWAGPFAALLFGAFGLWFAIRNWYNPNTKSASKADKNSDEATSGDMKSRIQKELDSIDM
ncbi:cytochrome c-type biogenesis protein [Magnetococcus sp. PR-3]|uniref:cytochrome c-type biogenesis protein n=1 Tax=Magnetococcus sp. PR-3 TaxID=3120355 RepID=UPI002FCE0D96